jgi:hypothetical protein
MTVRQLVQGALPFVEDGLRLNQRCIVVAGPTSLEAWQEQLLGLGLRPDDNAAGAVSLWERETWQPPGTFGSLRMAKRVWETIETSLEHYDGLRVAIDMRWTRDADIAADLVCHMEATLDQLLPDELAVQFLCQYDRLRLPAATLHAALRTHPSIFLGERVVPNLYYEAPAILDHEPDLNACSSDPEFVGRLLSQFVPPL